MPRTTKYSYDAARDAMRAMQEAGQQITIKGLRIRLGGSADNTLKGFIERFSAEPKLMDSREELELDGIPLDFRPAYMRMLSQARKQAMAELETQRAQIEAARKKLESDVAAFEATAARRGQNQPNESATALRRRNAELEQSLRDQVETVITLEARAASLETSLKAAEEVNIRAHERAEGARLAGEAAQHVADEASRFIATTQRTQEQGQAMIAEFMAASTRTAAATVSQLEQIKQTVLRMEARRA